jgi:hypothetical protein
MDIPIENILERLESLEDKVDQFIRCQTPKEKKSFSGISYGGWIGGVSISYNR